MQSPLRVSLALAAIAAVMLSAAPGPVGAATPPKSKPEFRATLDKTSYAGGEPVMLTFTLNNTGREPVWVNTRFYLSSKTAPEDDREVYLILTSPSGKELPCTFSYPTGFPKTDYFVRLEPGQEASSEHPRDVRGFFELKEPGTYTLQAVYHNVFGAELGLDAVKGPLESKPITFTISQ